MMIEEELTNLQRIGLRNEICSLIMMADLEVNYYLQGNIMRQLGFTEHEAHYPNDTWVGELRLKGYKNQKKT